MNAESIGLLRFQEAYFERIWGGTRLQSELRKPVPEDKTIGEAWLISDHAEHESVVAGGPHGGRSLHNLVKAHPETVLGHRARLTPQERFPLLLKILDSADRLSVQVHPDDAVAQRLSEPDTGKTEMWHVLDADPCGELVCGLDEAVSSERLRQAMENGDVENLMARFEAPVGTSVFVPSGTVHAIGGGMLLAEIQQNSNLTYRLYDYKRRDDQGRPRELHLDKALASIRFGRAPAGPAKTLPYYDGDATITVLCACPYFAAEDIHVPACFTRSLDGGTFHILLAKAGPVAIEAAGSRCVLQWGEAVLVPAGAVEYCVEGPGELLDYFVPDIDADILAPLQRAGHPPETIEALSISRTT